jgi:hypothetical protein
MVLDPDVQLRGAIGAVLSTASDEERARLEASLNVLRAISALTAGVPVDLDAVLERNKGIETVPLPGLWHEVLAEQASE